MVRVAAGRSSSSTAARNSRSVDLHAATMKHMTTSLFQEQLDKRGITLSHDHARWMVE